MAREIKRNKDGLTKRQAEFVVNYVYNGGNGTQAALSAGYAESSAHQRAYEMLRMPVILNAIDKETRAYIRKLGPLAIAQIAKLAVSAQSETVRITASTDLANRSGYKLPQVIEMQAKVDGQELDNRIMELLKQLGDSLDPAILQALQAFDMAPQGDNVSKH